MNEKPKELIKNKPLFLFDVDGTLTEPRQQVEEDFKEQFLEWSSSNNVILVTGSDFSKTLFQLGPDIIDNVLYTFCCMGNELRYKESYIIYSKLFKTSIKLRTFLNQALTDSEFPYRTGTHVEHRPGMLNYSIVGRDATLEQRKEYAAWDAINGERKNIAAQINNAFPDLEAAIGGSISIDIIPKGNNKSQAIDYIMDYLYLGEIQQIVFFGDKTDPGGNDYSIIKKAETCEQLVCHSVKDYHETLDILKNSYFSP